MIDGHIHLEYGDYTLEYIQKFVDKAVEMHLDEIWLLEHNYMFPEFSSMYDSVCAHSSFVNDWFHRKAGRKSYESYLDLIKKVRKEVYPVKIRFGLEVCYFKGYEDLVVQLTKDKGLDFLLGSIHFVGDFAFDHTAELWKGVDVDETYAPVVVQPLFNGGRGKVPESAVLKGEPLLKKALEIRLPAHSFRDLSVDDRSDGGIAHQGDGIFLFLVHKSLLLM